MKTPRTDYDALAASYDRRYREESYDGVASALRDLAHDLRDGTLLEVGCGTGHWLALLLGLGVRVAGLDASPQMLARARTALPDVDLRVGRAEQLPWGDTSFDGVVCINAVHHFDDPPAFISEAHRVLRPRGRLMIVALDPHEGRDRWCIYDYFEGTFDADLRRYPSTASLRSWMAAAGFVDCATTETHHLNDRMPAQQALTAGTLERTRTSQLANLDDRQYQAGLERIRRDIEAADSRGETLELTADLRLYRTTGVRGRVRNRGFGDT